MRPIVNIMNYTRPAIYICFSNDSEEFDRLLDSNDEDFCKFERGSKNFLGALLDIPEGSAESIALSLLGK